MDTTIAKQQLLVHETKNEHEYDRKQALRIWQFIQDAFVDSDLRGYIEYPHFTDEDRIISLFELLNGAILGDVVFADLANLSQGSTLIERGEDE